ncbi:hypothetical protein [Aquibium microcysteis]|uniref:hypothetical protein n=1 Tax=Aquibium microcysteis TaxID=675281 RepID=UPI00165D1446|nr:hypothetical protein [Aquibium microcysteis]
MHHVSVNFVPPPAPDRPAPLQQFRRSTWLLENARHVKRFGTGEKLCVVLVGHTDGIPKSMIEELGDSFTVRIETLLYEQICDCFPSIVQAFGGRYQIFTFAFMRWLLIERLFGGAPVLCYDGDILHNVPLDSLSRAFRGITRTATSTAFASISNPDWFKAWAEGLARLERDPRPALGRSLAGPPHAADDTPDEGRPRRLGDRARTAIDAAFAAVSRPGWLTARRSGPGDREEDRSAAGGDAVVKLADPRAFETSPEEYFAKFLIETGALPQDELDDTFPFWIVPQPHLLPRLYNFVETRSLNRIATPMRYRRTDGTDYINDRPPAFWHMQKPFMSQLSLLALLRDGIRAPDVQRIHAYNFYGRVPSEDRVSLIDPYHSDGGYDVVPKAQAKFAKSLIERDRERMRSDLPAEENPFHPAFLYRYFFERHDLSLLFNDQRWPKPGCWRA